MDGQVGAGCGGGAGSGTGDIKGLSEEIFLVTANEARGAQPGDPNQTRGKNGTRPGKSGGGIREIHRPSAVVVSHIGPSGRYHRRVRISDV